MLCFKLMPRSFNIAHRLSDSNMTLKAQVKHSSKKCMILQVEIFYSVLFLGSSSYYKKTILRVSEMENHKPCTISCYRTSDVANEPVFIVLTS